MEANVICKTANNGSGKIRVLKLENIVLNKYLFHAEGVRE
jgi:predicted ATP-binding protein involved in virulence